MIAGEKIRVLIADDSPVVREVLRDMIAAEKDLEVAGEAVNGRQAVELAAAVKPDIITMDVMMPVMNGLEAVEEIMAFNPTPILVFSSAVSDKEMDVAFQAIARGALDVMEKPKAVSGQPFDEIRLELLAKLRLLSRIHVIPHLRARRKRRQQEKSAANGENHQLSGPETPAPGLPLRPAAAPPAAAPLVEILERAPLEPTPHEPVPLPRGAVHRRLVAVGASTGGPKALVQIFRSLPAQLPVPVLAVQHIAHSFAPGLVAWINRESPMSVELAQDRERPQPGTLYISPTGIHMILEKGLIRLSDSPPVNSCKPSVDELFFSVAKEMGELAVGALLTGMGRDGAEGLYAMKKKGALTLVQDERTSVIFGMPRAAIELGAEDEVIPLPEMARAIVRSLAAKPNRRGGESK